jgi:hypothetical protein
MGREKTVPRLANTHTVPIKGTQAGVASPLEVVAGGLEKNSFSLAALVDPGGVVLTTLWITPVINSLEYIPCLY